MQIVLARIDERLIHGQLLVSWTKKLHAQRIIVVDDVLSEDAFARSVMMMTVPVTVRVEVISVEAAAILLAHTSPDDDDLRTILLFRSPEAVFRLHKVGFSVKSLNLGCMSARLGRIRITGHVYASESEIRMLREMEDDGMEIYLQVVYAETKLMLDKALASSGIVRG